MAKIESTVAKKKNKKNHKIAFHPVLYNAHLQKATVVGIFTDYCSLCKNFVYCFLFFVLSLLQFLVEISLSTALSFLKNRTLLHLSHLPYCGLLTLALLVVGVGAVGEEAVIWTLGAAWGFGQFGLGCVLAGQFVFDLGDFEWFRVFDLVWAWVFGVGVLLMVNFVTQIST